MATSIGDVYLKRIVLDNKVYTVDAEVANEILRLNSIIDKMQRESELAERRADADATEVAHIVMANLFSDGGDRRNAVLKHGINHMENGEFKFRNDVHKRVYLGVRGKKVGYNDLKAYHVEEV